MSKDNDNGRVESAPVRLDFNKSPPVEPDQYGHIKNGKGTREAHVIPYPGSKYRSELMSEELAREQKFMMEAAGIMEAETERVDRVVSADEQRNLDEQMINNVSLDLYRLLKRLDTIETDDTFNKTDHLKALADSLGPLHAQCGLLIQLAEAVAGRGWDRPIADVELQLLSPGGYNPHSYLGTTDTHQDALALQLNHLKLLGALDI